MPKPTLKYEGVTSFIINSNIDINISKLNGETIINRNNYNNVLADIKPPFPPTLTINDLIKNALKSPSNNKPKTLPNSFIAYRMSLINEYRVKNRKLPPMGEFSKIAKNSWNKEPRYVKDFYESLVEDAKSIYKQNEIQILLDKHMNDNMNYVGKDRKSGRLKRQSHKMKIVTDVVWDNIQVLPVENAICTENSANEHFLIQDSTVRDENFSHDNKVIHFAEMNYKLNDQDYMKILEQDNRMLEQVMNNLLRN